MSSDKKAGSPFQPCYERFQESMKRAKKSGDLYNTLTSSSSSPKAEIGVFGRCYRLFINTSPAKVKAGTFRRWHRRFVNTSSTVSRRAKTAPDGIEDSPLPEDYSDLLRWEYVASVSALDKLTHDLLRVGMLQIFEQTPDAKTYQKFAKFYREALEKNSQWTFDKEGFKKYVTEANRTESYEKMDMLSNAFVLICPDIFKAQPGHMKHDNQKLAWYIFGKMPEEVRRNVTKAYVPYQEALKQAEAEDAQRRRMEAAQRECRWQWMPVAVKARKEKMDKAKRQKEEYQAKAVSEYILYHNETIIFRRNQIVHQSDFPNYSEEREEIDPETVNQAWAYIDALGRILYEALEPPADDVPKGEDVDLDLP